MESPSTLIGNLGPSPAGHRPGPSGVALPPRPPHPAHSAPHPGQQSSPQRRRPAPLHAPQDAPGAAPADGQHPEQRPAAGAGGRAALPRVWEADAVSGEEPSAALREELQRSRADVRKLQARAGPRPRDAAPGWRRLGES